MSDEESGSEHQTDLPEGEAEAPSPVVPAADGGPDESPAPATPESPPSAEAPPAAPALPPAGAGAAAAGAAPPASRPVSGQGPRPAPRPGVRPGGKPLSKSAQRVVPKANARPVAKPAAGGVPTAPTAAGPGAEGPGAEGPGAAAPRAGSGKPGATGKPTPGGKPQPGTPKGAGASKGAGDKDREVVTASADLQPKAKDSRERRAREIERRKAAAAAAVKAKRKRQTYTFVVIGVIIAIVAVLILVFSGGGKTPTAAVSPGVTSIPTGTVLASPSIGALGPEGIPVPSAPVLASASTGATGQSVDGISCLSTEQLAYHVHTHLTVFVDGSARQIPLGIGIPGGVASNGYMNASGSCIYYLHTHASDGIIHIESPKTQIYTLGDFFDEWGQPLGPNQVGPATGKVTAFFNGKMYTGSNPRNLPLISHGQIQLDVGGPLVGPVNLTSWGQLGT